MKGFLAGVILTIVAEGAIAVAIMIKYGKERRGCVMKLVIEAAMEVVICIAAILKVIKKK